MSDEGYEVFLMDLEEYKEDMDSLDNISEANKIYYEIKAIADELSKDYADNQVTQMLSMGIVRKL